MRGERRQLQRYWWRQQQRGPLTDRVLGVGGVVAGPDLHDNLLVDFRGIHVVLRGQDLDGAAAVDAAAGAERDEARHDRRQVAVVEGVVVEDRRRARVGEQVGVALLQGVVGEAPVALARALRR